MQLGSPTTYEISAPIASQLAYTEHKIFQQPQLNSLQNFEQQKSQQKQLARVTVNFGPQPFQQQLYYQQPPVYQQQPQLVQQQPYLQLAQINQHQFNNNRQPITYNQQAVAYNHQPVAYNQQPVVYNQQPVAYHQHQVAYNNQQQVLYNQPPLNQFRFQSPINVLPQTQPGITYVEQGQKYNGGIQPEREVKTPQPDEMKIFGKSTLIQQVCD